MPIPEEPVIAGRWLQPGDDEVEVVVLNHVTAAATSDARVGRSVTISVDGEPHDWRVVGIVRDLGSPATAYVSLSTFSRVTQTTGSWRAAPSGLCDGDPTPVALSSRLPPRRLGSGLAGTTEQLGVSTQPQDSVARAEVIRRVERALEDAGMAIDISLPVEMLRTAKQLLTTVDGDQQPEHQPRDQ